MFAPSFGRMISKGLRMKKFAWLIALSVSSLPVVAQDVLMESDTEEWELLRVDNTGTSGKVGVNILNTSTGIRTHAYETSESYILTGLQTNIWDTDAWSVRGFESQLVSGDYSAPTGVYLDVSGGYGSYVTGVHVTANSGPGGTEIAGYFDGELHYKSLHEISDQMFKRNIRDLQGGLDKIMALKPRLYEMKTEEYKGRLNLSEGEQIGLIAQEVETVLPQLVTPTAAPVRLTKDERAARVKKEPVKYKSLDYTGLIPVLVAAVQEQQAMLLEQKTEIEVLRAEVAALRK